MSFTHARVVNARGFPRRKAFILFRHGPKSTFAESILVANGYTSRKGFSFRMCSFGTVCRWHNHKPFLFSPRFRFQCHLNAIKDYPGMSASGPNMYEKHEMGAPPPYPASSVVEAGRGCVEAEPAAASVPLEIPSVGVEPNGPGERTGGCVIPRVSDDYGTRNCHGTDRLVVQL